MYGKRLFLDDEIVIDASFQDYAYLWEGRGALFRWNPCSALLRLRYSVISEYYKIKDYKIQDLK